ncbi:cysteine protease [Pseudomonas sp. GM79]|uniref:C1 family peptidase n=1 Tax=Pseudomonas sp. GM79 TaxID=1144338 RepID=UPI00026F61DA|nr:C1 family peptidase [Pseudomonas sp. GM79]EJN22648.1 cysteine protease [Pseudomonas sp. GM79]
MTVLDYFKPIKLLLKESTNDEFVALNIQEAKIDHALTMPPLPATFSIRNEMTAVEDQGGQGSCTSFCVVACLEHMHQRDLSEALVTHEAETTYGDCSEGLALIHGYQQCSSLGSVDEALWQYDAMQTCWVVPPNISGAARYKYSGIGFIYQRPRADILNIMRSSSSLPKSPGLPMTFSLQQNIFARRKPVSVSVPVVLDAWPWSGEITMPPPALVSQFIQTMTPPNTSGWHCIAICGWDNTTGRFLFKNSWGSFWGDNGYGTIPYQYIDMFSDTAMVGW